MGARSSPGTWCYPKRVGEFRPRARAARRLAAGPLLAGLLLAGPLLAGLLLAGGCSYFTVDDAELDRAIADAGAALAARDPEAAIRRLRKVAERRPESVRAREMLVEALLRQDTIESRRRAENLLGELVALEPDVPQHRYALASLYLRRGFDRYAFEALQDLLALAPRHAGGYLVLADYYRAQWQRYNEDADLQALLAACERATRLDPASDEVSRRWVTSLMLVGRFAEARARLDTLCARAPADAWLHALRATCLAARQRQAAAAAEFELALDGMPAGERQPFVDIALLADPQTAGRYHDLPPGEGRDFLRAFWKAQDPTPTTPVNERLVEHYRRVTMADVLYENPRLGMRGFHTARGEFYIRYGAPVSAVFVNGYISGQLVPPHWVHGYRVGNDVLYVTFMDYALSGRFYQSIGGFPSAADEAAYTRPQAYAYVQPGHSLGHAMAGARFRQEDGRVREEVYLGVPADSLRWLGGAALRVETVAFNELWEEEARVEETLALDQAARAGSGGRSLVHQVALALPPGRYHLATMVRDAAPADGEPGGVLSSRTRELTIAPFPQHGLGLSDLELAYAVRPGGSGRFTKGEVTVLPNASGRYRDGELLNVYFEIYGLQLAAGRGRYELSYRIRPAASERGGFLAGLANAFRNKTFIEARLLEESAGPDAQRYLTIDIGALAPDRYQLTMRVTDRTSGAQVTGRARFERVAHAPPRVRDAAVH